MQNNESKDHALAHVWLPLRTNEVNPETLKIVDKFIDQVPDLPLSVDKIIELASDEEGDLGELVEVVSSDPALVSNILKVVNSSYYGLSHKTDNLHLAIVLLGLKEVKKIIMRSYVSRTLATGKSHTNYSTDQLWEHSYLVSVCAEMFCREDDQQNRGVYLTLGLLHDISKFAFYDIAILLKKNGITPPGIEDMPESVCLLEKEQRLFGVNHPIVGGVLARKWNLSQRFISVLECHHYPSFFNIAELPNEYTREIIAICFSDLIVNRFLNIENNLPTPPQPFFEVLGLHPPLENIINQELENKLINARKFVSHLH